MSDFLINAFADESSPEFDGQIDAMLRNRLNGIEIRNVEGKNIADLTDAELCDIKLKLDNNGLKTWSIGSRLGKIEITDEFDQHLDEFKRTIEIAHKLSAQYIRLFSFYMPKDENPEIYKDEVFARLTKFVEVAKGSGVLLCHENEKGIYGDIAPRCAEIFENVNGLGCIFDPANFIQSGQDTLEAWELLGNRVTYMHIKDCIADGSIVPAGKGCGKLPEILKMYKANGGVGLTLEPHLSIFKGLAGLEREGEKSVVGKFQYPSKEAAFDAAVAALRDII